ncbi:carbon monoxide dehydrogenase accessory protein CooC [Thermodesulfovibrionales bacterium]|nr:carbon monoxide dehydrogenase accessory protein CooC [Thermodesulfovibrionales bacterium]MCL0096882.1 carbon monoxide dehydrogenase accessory protein CooC [Thermodesulfovibrionales bacterium]
MKLAITGKGGVGKTTLSAILSHLFALDGRRVIAIDADPDANLAQALGIKASDIKEIRSIAEMPDLIEERTGAKPGSMGGFFRLNPRVDDLPEGIGYKIDGIALLVIGKSKATASGCFCPENILLRRLLRHLFVEREDVVIADMEAGIEHLTRGTAEAVDAFIVVVEPGQRSIQTAETVKEMAGRIGVKKVFAVANKIRSETDAAFIQKHIEGMELLGEISFSQSIMDADIKGISPFEEDSGVVGEVKEIKERLSGLFG